jgi:putative ABC transport system substrate-binding protein
MKVSVPAREVRLQGCCGYHAQTLGSFEPLLLNHLRHWLWTAPMVSGPVKVLFQRIQCWPLSLGADMRRREFITLIGGTAAAWPLATRAQQSDGIRRIGVLMGYPETDSEAQAVVAVFRQELHKLGWVEGRNVQINTRWGSPDDADLTRRLAKELVEQQPDLILSHVTPTTAALLQHTRTIPIIFANVADPVGSGFVASFPRPGGNATGFSAIEGSLAGKWLELLREIAPRVNRVAFLFNPVTAPFAENYLTPFKAAAASFAVEAIPAPVRNVSEIESFAAEHARAPNGGLIVMPESFMVVHRGKIILLAARYGLPTVYPRRYFAEDGGLLSYGIDQHDQFRQVAAYADRILKGAKPSELPVQAPVKFELVINLKTAKALSLDVPFLLEQRADEVIE